ncbi:putative ribonuclease H1 [Aspergillus clavatus NRRL 1]|uniref:ribonuclease H n=1 Tax=Aspergillus clavatus (strain ATCC 1007 / CBS 513.65 / DSM 816 / NCTC 3887 / NRRL 1 / QM 1276 / 107) TaxID=344612 RepID=A1CQB1_ASPCL|nr:reverse transcriptase, RNaseH, putative [Aspergillus clavatus NRRL 1]EAW07832.1 reverse transcriptase, RNaseH, putative [Aspergillus clavatus NRRL 1]
MRTSYADLRFLPDRFYPDGMASTDIEVSMDPWVHLASPQPRAAFTRYPAYYAKSIVVAVDGACLYNGRAQARASLGVYWGANNYFNTGIVLDPTDRQTNQVAELQACLEALGNLDDVSCAHPAGDRLSTVVIKSDSEYMVRGITEWFPSWRNQRWRNYRGMPVTNLEYFRMIDEYIEDWEAQGLSVKFWLVPRSMNRMADGLAKDALH